MVRNVHINRVSIYWIKAISYNQIRSMTVQMSGARNMLSTVKSIDEIKDQNLSFWHSEYKKPKKHWVGG